MHHRRARTSWQTTKPTQLIHDGTREEKIPLMQNERETTHDVPVSPSTSSESKCSYLIHPSTQNHKECIEELKIFVDIMNPKSMRQTRGQCIDVSDERVFP